MRIAVPRLHQNRKSQAYGFSCEAGAAAPRVPLPNRLTFKGKTPPEPWSKTGSVQRLGQYRGHGILAEWLVLDQDCEEVGDVAEEIGWAVAGRAEIVFGGKCDRDGRLVQMPSQLSHCHSHDLSDWFCLLFSSGVTV